MEEAETGQSSLSQMSRGLEKLTALSFCTVAALAAILCVDRPARAQDAPQPTPAPSTAQVPTTQGPVVRQEPDNRTPAQRAAENYDAPGVRVGSFLLFPELEADEAFNDNIYATSNATGKTGSFIQVIKPSVKLNSDWSTHMLNLFANAAFSIYSADSTQNTQDFAVGGDGRYDIQKEQNAYAGVSYSRQHEALGTPNTVAGQTQPNIYYQLAGNVGYYQAFGRIKTRLDGRVDNFNYLNNPFTFGVIPNSDRDRTEVREAVRVGYEFLPGYEIWTRGSLNQRMYRFVPDSNGFYRNSSGFDIVGGFALDFGGITSMELFAGYIQQNYVDVRFQQISLPTFGLTGYWNPYRPLWIKPYVKRTVDDSSLANAVAYINTSGGLDVDYAMRPNIKVTGHADYSFVDYLQATGTSTAEHDQYLTLRVGLLYQPTPNFYLGPTYQFVNRTSNIFNSDYNQNLIMLRLGARL